MNGNTTDPPELECSFPLCDFTVIMDGDSALVELSRHQLTEHQGVDP